MFCELHEILKNGGKILQTKDTGDALEVTVQLSGIIKVQSVDIDFYFEEGK